MSKLVGLREYARHKGVQAGAVSLAENSGRLNKSVVRDENGKFLGINLELADQEWEANTDADKKPITHRKTMKKGSDDSPTPGDLDSDSVPVLSVANARAKHWDAKLRRLKYLAAARELVNASEVQSVYVSRIIACKTRLLAIPSRFKQQFPDITMGELDGLDALIRETLEDLAAGNE